MTLAIIGLIIFIAILLWQNSLMTFKVSYYEETLKNNKGKFSEKRYRHIEKVKAMKNPFKKLD